jgi:hypothetical protein
MAELRKQLIELRAEKGFARYGGDDGGERTDTPVPAVDPAAERLAFLAKHGLLPKVANKEEGNTDAN